MKRLGAMYSMRSVAKDVGQTDSRTVLAVVYKLGIPTVEAGGSILIDDAGLARVIAHYKTNRANRARRVKVPA